MSGLCVSSLWERSARADQGWHNIVVVDIALVVVVIRIIIRVLCLDITIDGSFGFQLNTSSDGLILHFMDKDGTIIRNQEPPVIKLSSNYP